MLLENGFKEDQYGEEKEKKIENNKKIWKLKTKNWLRWSKIKAKLNKNKRREIYWLHIN